MHVNYRYLLDFAERQRDNTFDYTVLDYGCGAADVVQAGRERGLNVYGAEVFYAGGSTREIVRQKGLLGTVVREIQDGHLNFPNSFFDLVINNQVFEHVKELDRVLGEIDRVLKPGGKVLCVFPSRESWREPHCGIPFLHWFPVRSKLRYWYALLLRRAGLGYHKGDKTAEQWTKDFLNWIDEYCHYRTRKSVLDSLRRHFQVELIEWDYVAFRLKGPNRRIAALFGFPLLNALSSLLFARLGFLVILGIKSSQATASDKVSPREHQW